MKRLTWLGLAMALLAGCGGGGGGGNDGPSIDVVAVTTDGRVIAFDTRNPNAYDEAAITGLGAGETIVGIDERPNTGGVYAVSNTGVVYVLNRSTGAATAVGPDEVVVDAAATASDIDFNPQVDRIRLGNATDQNLRVNPDNGVQVDGDPGTPGTQRDADFAYANASAAEVVGLAYTNSTSGAASTTLYALDRAQDRLCTLASPNAGVLTAVGDLGIDVTGRAPFDITPDNAYAVAAVEETERSRIVRIDLATGEASTIGRTPLGIRLVGLAVYTPVAIP